MIPAYIVPVDALQNLYLTPSSPSLTTLNSFLPAYEPTLDLMNLDTIKKTLGPNSEYHYYEK